MTLTLYVNFVINLLINAIEYINKLMTPYSASPLSVNKLCLIFFTRE